MLWDLTGSLRARSKGVLEFLPFVCLAMCAELWKRLKLMEGEVEFCDLMPVLQLNPREVGNARIIVTTSSHSRTSVPVH